MLVKSVAEPLASVRGPVCAALGADIAATSNAQVLAIHFPRVTKGRMWAKSSANEVHTPRWRKSSVHRDEKVVRNWRTKEEQRRFR